LGVNSAQGHVGIAAVCSALLLSLIGCGLFTPTSFNFTELRIDSDLHLIPIGPHLPARVATPGSFYSVFHTGTGLTLVEHFIKQAGVDSPERLLYLEAGKNQVLDRTVKSVEILKGPFGSVYADKTCFYASPIERGYSAVSVRSYFHTPVDEKPSELTTAPENMPPLTSLSLVRVFRDAPEFVVVSANYEPGGALGSVNVSDAKGGDWARGETHMVPAEGRLGYLQKYGIPVSIDVQSYVRLHRVRLPSVALPQEFSAMVQHYNYDRMIRVDTLKDNTAVSSRFLQPSVTSEERDVLDALCEARFHQQLKMGLPTVEANE
jgi:hypothetical protein